LRACASLLLALACGCAQDVPEFPRTGTLRVTVLVERAPRELPLLVLDKNVEHCGPTLQNPVLALDTELVQDAVLSIDWPRSVPSAAPVELHLRNEGCLMQPRVQIGRTGDVLVLGSTDEITHNPHGWLDGRTTVFNITMLGSAYSFRRTLARAGHYRIDCDTHKWMRGHVHVFDHPYAARSDAQGRAELALPEGERELTVWHEVLGTRTVSVLVVAGETAELTIRFPLEDRRARALVPPNEEPWSP